MTGAPIDRTVLDTLRDLREPGQPDVLTELIDLFLEDAPARLAAVRDAVGRQDGEALRQAAHGFKGSAASLGATEVRALCAELERLGRRGPLGAAEALLQQLDDAYGRAETALRAERSTE